MTVIPAAQLPCVDAVLVRACRSSLARPGVTLVVCVCVVQMVFIRAVCKFVFTCTQDGAQLSGCMTCFPSELCDA